MGAAHEDGQCSGRGAAPRGGALHTGVGLCAGVLCRGAGPAPSEQLPQTLAEASRSAHGRMLSCVLTTGSSAAWVTDPPGEPAPNPQRNTRLCPQLRAELHSPLGKATLALAGTAPPTPASACPLAPTPGDTPGGQQCNPSRPRHAHVLGRGSQCWVPSAGHAESTVTGWPLARHQNPPGHDSSESLQASPCLHDGFRTRAT